MQGCPQGISKIDIHVLFQNLTAELFLLESPDNSYFPKLGGSTFLKTVGSHFSKICGNNITAYSVALKDAASLIAHIVTDCS